MAIFPFPWVGHRCTYRGRGGRRKKGQNPSTGDDYVVYHLGDEMDGIVDKNDVFIAINKVHDRFGAVAAERHGNKVIVITVFFGGRGGGRTICIYCTVYSLSHSYLSSNRYTETPLQKITGLPLWSCLKSLYNYFSSHNTLNTPSPGMDITLQSK